METIAHCMLIPLALLICAVSIGLWLAIIKVAYLFFDKLLYKFKCCIRDFYLYFFLYPTERLIEKIVIKIKEALQDES